MRYEDFVANFKSNPRDIHTVPLDGRTPKWFYISVENDTLCATIAKNHNPSSKITQTRILKPSEYEAMINLYHRRKHGEAVSAEATQTTRDQVYWYGVFNELNI